MLKSHLIDGKRDELRVIASFSARRSPSFQVVSPPRIRRASRASTESETGSRSRFEVVSTEEIPTERHFPDGVSGDQIRKTFRRNEYVFLLYGRLEVVLFDLEGGFVGVDEGPEHGLAISRRDS